MHVTINGHNMDVGQALQQHASGKLSELTRYQIQLVDGHVTFSKSAKGAEAIKADVSVSAHGLNIRAHAQGADPYAVFEEAADKLEQQLRRYKDRLKKHERRRLDMGSAFAAVEVAHHTVDEAALEEAPDDIFAEYMPKIVKKDVRKIHTMTVDEAVMQMDLQHTNFCIFNNPQSKSLNVVYRDSDGSIGWVCPQG